MITFILNFLTKFRKLIFTLIILKNYLYHNYYFQMNIKFIYFDLNQSINQTFLKNFYLNIFDKEYFYYFQSNGL
jgi:hypothetical protein